MAPFLRSPMQQIVVERAEPMMMLLSEVEVDLEMVDMLFLFTRAVRSCMLKRG